MYILINKTNIKVRFAFIKITRVKKQIMLTKDIHRGGQHIYLEVKNTQKQAMYGI